MLPRLLFWATLVVTVWPPSHIAQAQTFEPGYWIVNGDTLVGEIRLDIESQNANGGVFRRDSTADAREFGPADSDGYGVWGGREYRRGLYQVYARRDDNGGTPNDRLAFARVVRDGTVDLLALDVINGRTFYYLQTASEDLIGLYPPGEAQSRRTRSAYRQALAAVLYPCVDRVDDDLRFSERAFAELVDAFNACQDPAYAVPEFRATAQRIRVRLQWEMGVGGMRSTLQRRRPPPAPLTSADPTLAGVQVRAAAVLVPPAFGGRVQPFADVEYAHDVGKYIDSKGFGYTMQSFSIALAGLGVRYEFPVGAMRVQAGVALQSGALLGRGGEADIRLADQPDALLLVNGRKRMGGQYVEIGIRPTSAPIAITARMQSAALGYDPLYPQSSNLYRLRGASLGIVARL